MPKLGFFIILVVGAFFFLSASAVWVVGVYSLFRWLLGA